MTPDPCDLRSLDPRTRDLTLAAVRGWTCRWPCPPDGPRLVMPAKPYQPPQAGRAPGRAYEGEWFPDGDRLRFDPEAYAWRVEQEEAATLARERKEREGREGRLP